MNQPLDKYEHPNLIDSLYIQSDLLTVFEI